jgi:putative hydrolase of the HAD superfamily
VIRAVVSDLFGTLTPKWTRRVSAESKREIAAAIGVSASDFGACWHRTFLERETGRITLEGSLADTLTCLGIAYDDDLIAGLAAKWKAVVQHLVAPRNSHVLDTLRWCRERGLKTGLVSNAGPTVPPLFRTSAFAPLFDAAVFSCDVGVAKPNAKIYESVCALLSVDPRDCVYIGDGQDEELQGAERLGMKPVLLRIDSELEEDGLPPGAARWQGPVLHSFMHLRQHVENETGLVVSEGSGSAG